MLQNDVSNRVDVARVEAVNLGKFHGRFEPELRFPVCVMYMDMDPRFLSREEEEPGSHELAESSAHTRIVALQPS